MALGSETSGNYWDKPTLHMVPLWSRFVHNLWLHFMAWITHDGEHVDRMGYHGTHRDHGSS